MNYSRPLLLEALAQRYVLGTMGLMARKRFARLLAEEPTAQDRMLAWEEILSPMALALEPVQPSQLVWMRIAREIKRSLQQPVTPVLSPSAKPPALYRVAMVALLIGIGLAGAGWWNASHKAPQTIVETVIETVTEPVPEEAIVSVISADNGPLWVARIYPAASNLDIRVHTAPESRPDNDYELWALMDDGTPVSLGLLPKAGSASLALDTRALAAIARSSTLAVSVEPLGGSPQLVPTGPVIYTAPLLSPDAGV